MNTLTVVKGQDVKAPNGKRIYESANGKKFIPEKWADWQAELFFFGTKTGHAKFLHFKRLIELQWPVAFVWDEWADLFFGALCGDAEIVEKCIGSAFNPEGNWWTKVISTGAASTGKSSKAALWILCQWLCAQADTSVVLTSTSLDQLKRRIWAELCSWIDKARYELPLEIIASDTEIRYRAGDKRSAIFGIAVKSGGVIQDAIDRIKGIHNRRVFVVIDEMTAVALAITAACSNLNKGTKEFQLLGLANAVPGDNPHTMYCEPMDGWPSVTVEDIFWKTKKGGCCIHFDGHKSPAIADPIKFHFYIKQSELDADRDEFGGENTPEYWTNDRGFWPPTGLSNTVMDAALLNQFAVSEAVVWRDSFEMHAAFDPAFEGGDRRVLYPFKVGQFASGTTGIEFQSPIVVGIDISTDVRWIHYAIADAVQQQCEQYQINGKMLPILPKNFTMDTTGEGGGLFSVLSGRWSAEIQSVEFGGAAEKVVISADRPTTYFELYGNRVTMLYYVFRRYVEGGQIKGLSDIETRTELTSREKGMRNGKTVVKPKKDMKLASHRSPDKADAAVIATEALRRKGILPAGKTGGVIAFSLAEWNKKAKRFSTYEDQSYTDSNAAYA